MAKMKLQVNGTTMDVETGTTIKHLLERKDVDPATVVVEVNLTIIPRDEYAAVTLKENDSIEILRFVGGG